MKIKKVYFLKSTSEEDMFFILDMLEQLFGILWFFEDDADSESVILGFFRCELHDRSEFLSQLFLPKIT